MPSQNANVKAVILAGGQGTRFWPISRRRRPKQFLSISANGESLIQATARRIEKLVGPQNIWAVANEMHATLIHEHVPNARIICEPQGRNTAPSIALAAIYLEKENPGSVMIVLPADHAVGNEPLLLETLKQAIELAKTKDSLITIGITPTSAHTGYGYIKRGSSLGNKAYNVNRFYEKPSHERALKYLESGEFYWNSGMFVWRAELFLESLKTYLPTLWEGLLPIQKALGTDKEAQEINTHFPALESISVDFGILEHARNCVVIEGKDLVWNDVGSWDAWAQHFKKENNGNLLHGDAIVIDSKNCVVNSEKRLVAIVGAEDLIVIDAEDCFLVCPRKHVQDVRKVVEELKRRGRTDLI